MDGARVGCYIRYPMDAVVWAAIGIMAAALFGSLFYLGGRIDALGGRMDARFGSLDARFDNLEARFDSLSARLGARFDAVGSVGCPHPAPRGLALTFPAPVS
jgi:hypothetical protein